jgi:riboflavin synthase
MFTGIIQGLGVVRSLRSTATGARLVLDAGILKAAPALGASIAINGVCQTVAACDFPVLEFDVVPETLRRTTLGGLSAGDRVNLESSLRPGDRLDGHFVQGHVDAVATVAEVDRAAGEWLVAFALEDPGAADCIIPKGSVAIDGISLTIADTDGPRFRVALIPTTLEQTTLAERQPGDRVNVETDILARTVIAFLRRTTPAAGRITPAFLREHGFA